MNVYAVASTQLMKYLKRLVLIFGPKSRIKNVVRGSVQFFLRQKVHVLGSHLRTDAVRHEPIQLEETRNVELIFDVPAILVCTTILAQRAQYVSEKRHQQKYLITNVNVQLH